jgi:Kdo2-lipid IVA lauroyltransferase/acyltransferase
MRSKRRLLCFFNSKGLEQQIIEDPQYLLWTHKRWKRKRKPEEFDQAKTVEHQIKQMN